MNKKAVIGDAFDILFTIIGAVFIYFFIAIMLSAQLPKESIADKDIAELNYAYYINHLQQSKIMLEGGEITVAEACILETVTPQLKEAIKNTFPEDTFKTLTGTYPYSKNKLDEIFNKLNPVIILPDGSFIELKDCAWSAILHG